MNSSSSVSSSITLHKQNDFDTNVILDYALVQAIQQGDVKAAMTCIRNGANIHFQDTHNNTPILLAAQTKFSCSFDMVDMLLTAGSNPNDANMEDWTPMHYVARNGDLDSIMVLHESRARVAPMDKRGRTPFMIAAMHGQKEAVHLLFQFGSQVNHSDKNGATSLMTAVEQSNAEVVNILLTYGANMHMQDNAGRTAVTIAVMNRDLAMAMALYAFDSTSLSFCQS